MIRQTLAGGQTKYKAPAMSDKLQLVGATQAGSLRYVGGACYIGLCSTYPA